MVKQFGQILPELGFQPRAIRLLPYSPGHSANQSKTMLSTSPLLSPQAPLIFHLTYPTSPGPCHHLQTHSTPSPTSSARYSHPHSEDLHCVHLLPIQSLPETSAITELYPPCSSLPLSHTQPALLLHVFTGTSIMSPSWMPQEADLAASPLDLPPGPGCDG